MPCLLALLFWAPAKALYLIFYAVLVVAAYEWHKLVPLQGVLANTLFAITYVLSLFAITYFHNEWLLNLIWIWIPIIFFILIYPKGTSYWALPAVTFVVTIVVSCLFAYAMQGLYSMSLGQILIVYAFCLVWAADIGAYTFGKLWGQHKLIPSVSPGKSWEGFLGGLIFVTVVALFGAIYFNPASLMKWFILNYSCFIVSIFGDLFISMLKRKCKLKDTGHILPGHGGILDRLDSLIAAAPVFYAGLIWLHLGFY